MRYDATVTRIVQETPNVATIFFTVNGGVLPFIAGQYLTVYLSVSDSAGKAYSISSAPWDTQLSITVKNIGAYSGRLCALRPHDTFQVSAPYGFFNVRSDAPIIALASGVGIAPIWSIMRDEVQQHPGRLITLLYTVPTRADSVFASALENEISKALGVTVTLFTTRQASPGAVHRRIEIQTDTTANERSHSQFYVCGSEGFVAGMWQQLMQAGVDESRIVTEVFFEAML